MLCRILKNISVSKHSEHLRKLSSSINQNVISEKNTSQPKEDFVHHSQFDSTKFVEPVPIKSLHIVNNIDKIEKQGSIFNNYFLGVYDKDLLSFPFLLRTRQEYIKMIDQYEMIRQTYNKINQDEDTLTLLGYNSLYNLSVSEMVFIFEAIGASVQKKMSFGTREDSEIRFEKKLGKLDSTNVAESSLQCFSDMRHTINTIVPLIYRNAMAYNAISKSSNSVLKEKLLEQRPNIGVAIYENEHGDSKNISNWISEAQLSTEEDYWVISGEKCNIIGNENDYSHYLVFCRTKDFTERQKFTEGQEDGVVALLLPRDQVEIELDYDNYFGVTYQKIKFRDVKLNRKDYEISKAKQDISEFLNIKGCGQIAISAVILGLLKQLQKNTYSYLINQNIELLNCELVQYKLFQATSKIYSIESMLYLTAAMFDSFESDFNLQGESIAVKTLATDYAFDVFHNLRSIFGPRHPISSSAMEFVNFFDSFLCSSLKNRILLGQSAIKHYLKHNPDYQSLRSQSSPASSIYVLKNYLKYRKVRRGLMFSSKKLQQYVHHNLQSATDWIENSLNQLEYSTNFLLNSPGNIFERGNDLNRITSIAMDIYMMTSCLSRANHSLCYGRRNNDIEKELCLAICKETLLRHLQIFEDTERSALTDNDAFARNVFEANLKDGYFPSCFEIM